MTKTDFVLYLIFWFLFIDSFKFHYFNIIKKKIIYDNSIEQHDSNHYLGIVTKQQLPVNSLVTIWEFVHKFLLHH